MSPKPERRARGSVSLSLSLALSFLFELDKLLLCACVPRFALTATKARACKKTPGKVSLAIEIQRGQLDESAEVAFFAANEVRSPKSFTSSLECSSNNKKSSAPFPFALRLFPPLNPPVKLNHVSVVPFLCQLEQRDKGRRSGTQKGGECSHGFSAVDDDASSVFADAAFAKAPSR